MKIGPYAIDNPLILAPMAGVTDRPFRQLCKKLGAGMVVSEMVNADPRLWRSGKTQRRIDHQGEAAPRVVQIAGYDPYMLAEAARFNVAQGAEIIDINMGCPAKKVCNVMAGSALLRDEVLVGRILDAVVNAVCVPVTLKIRTGWDPTRRNGVAIARIAEQSGVQAIAVHGRTRACRFRGVAEHDTTREIKAAVSIPVIANGDITTPEKARQVLDFTKADAIMIGRAAQGRPWIFRELDYYLRNGIYFPPPAMTEIRDILLGHLNELYRFYGEYMGVLIARKHLSWYSKGRSDHLCYWRAVNRVETAREQLVLTRDFFNRLATEEFLAA